MNEYKSIRVDKRKRYLLVVDIETANMINDALAYDIGFAVTDKKGQIYYTGSLMIADLFIDNKELLQTAYYKEKLPNYWKDYKNGTRQLVTLLTAKCLIRDIMKHFNIKDVFSQDLAIYLNKYKICIRAGNHCAKILKDELGVKNTCRASFYFYNTKEEIDKLVLALKNPNLKAEII